MLLNSVSLNSHMANDFLCVWHASDRKVHKDIVVTHQVSLVGRFKVLLTIILS